MLIIQSSLLPFRSPLWVFQVPTANTLLAVLLWAKLVVVALLLLAATGGLLFWHYFSLLSVGVGRDSAGKSLNPPPEGPTPEEAPW